MLPPSDALTTDFQATVSASGGNFTFNNLDFLACPQVYFHGGEYLIYAQIPGLVETGNQGQDCVAISASTHQAEGPSVYEYTPASA